MNERTYLYVSVVCVLSLTTVAALASSAKIYTAYRSVLKEMSTQHDVESLSTTVRTFTIESFDLRTGSAVLNVVNRQTRQPDHVLAYILEHTKVFKQDSIRRGGVIVGFTPLLKVRREDLAAGQRGTAILLIDKSGTLVATTIIVGEPFPRP